MPTSRTEIIKQIAEKKSLMSAHAGISLGNDELEKMFIEDCKRCIMHADMERYWGHDLVKKIKEFKE